MQAAEAQQRSEETEIKSKFGPMRQEVDRLEVGPIASAQRERQAISERLAHTIRLLTGEEEGVIKAGKRDVDWIEAAATSLRKELFGARWESARLVGRVKAYAPMRFGYYLRHIAFVSRGSSS